MSTITTGGNQTLLGYIYVNPPNIMFGDDIDYGSIKIGKLDITALNEKVQQMEILMKLQTDVIKSLTEKLEELYFAPGQPGYIKAQVEFAEQKRPAGLTARQARDAFESDEEISDIDE